MKSETKYEQAIEDFSRALRKEKFRKQRKRQKKWCIMEYLVIARMS